MKRSFSVRSCLLVLLTSVLLSQADEKALPGHVSQEDIERGRWTFAQLRLAGKRLFEARFTVEDGASRPGATGNPSPTRRPLGNAPTFIRTAGPDSNSCQGCHNQPETGGAGDFVTNVFVSTASREPVISSVSSAFTAERGTPAMHGSGAIEILAREMTGQLHSLRAAAIREAKHSVQSVRIQLVAKGVSFGYLSAEPDGNVKLNEVEGVDKDLVIRPWSQKGTVTSLRTFTINALNEHHGMEATERFGFAQTGTHDFDRDGIPDEISVGDVTALVLFQASLPVPGRLLPSDAGAQAKAKRGELTFDKIGCTSCHVPSMTIDNPTFYEPGPYNLEGTLRQIETKELFHFSLITDVKPGLEPLRNGKGIVRAYTDLKRHRICDKDRPHYCNETLVQGFVPFDQFITKRLWDVGNTGPYGHRGDLTTMREAILDHGAEATSSRIHFEGLSNAEQDEVIDFLKTLQILPEGSQRIVVQAVEPVLPYQSDSKDREALLTHAKQ